MNDTHANRIVSAVERGDGLGLDLAIASVVGNRMAIRREAGAAVSRFLRAGGDLPVPNLINTRTLDS